MRIWVNHNVVRIFAFLLMAVPGVTFALIWREAAIGPTRIETMLVALCGCTCSIVALILAVMTCNVPSAFGVPFFLACAIPAVPLTFTDVLFKLTLRRELPSIEATASRCLQGSVPSHVGQFTVKALDCPAGSTTVLISLAGPDGRPFRLTRQRSGRTWVSGSPEHHIGNGWYYSTSYEY